jgi:O-antigen/teichoic acid export membrane protein
MIKALLLRIINSIKKLRQGESLKLKAARGGVWLGAANGVEQGLRLLRNMILTRLLAPETFGVMAIVLAINAAFESFTEIGIQTAIIQNPKGRERTYLNGAWWLSMVRAVGLYTLAYIGAPWIAQFYSNPELLPLLRIAFLGVLFNGAMSPGIHVAIKQMNFKHWAIAYHGGGAIGILSAVLLALAMRDTWALVLGFTIEAASRCMLSYFVSISPGIKL